MTPPPPRMKDRTLARLGLAAGLLALAAFLLFRAFQGPHIDLNPYQALGSVAAEEAHRLAGGQGTVTLIVPDTSQGADPVLDAQIKAFRQALQRLPGTRLGVVETVALDPLVSMQTGGAIPPDRFLELHRKHAAAAVLVLFLPFPPVGGPEFDPPPAQGPRLMVVSAALPGYDTLLERGLLHLALVPRPAGDPGPAASDPTHPRAAFDREYLILRPPSRP